MNEYRPESLLCVVAHADDVDVLLGGTVAKWASKGTKVCYLICTDGSKGTSDTNEAGEKIAHIRAREQQAAADAVGAESCHQLSFCDGEIEVTDELRIEIVKAIRAHKPEAVFTMDPQFLYSVRWGYANHRDHRVVGEATFDAVYPMARDATTSQELLDDGYEPHTVKSLLLAHYEKENTFIDISEHFSAKEAGLRAHASQFGDGNAIVDHLHERAEHDGHNVDGQLAEGFILLDVSMGS